ncbi:hypothetical protein MHYP_G00153270 [Metynnis hypsauchen]
MPSPNLKLVANSTRAKLAVSSLNKGCGLYSSSPIPVPIILKRKMATWGGSQRKEGQDERLLKMCFL